ncbi:MAG: hypothetical protein IKM54_03950, partial [Butyricicoccus sp.]|nr:hypothetical protein [Butyricicoccus sp.]
NVTYTAEAGMTWEEWVESDYNTAGFFISSSSYVTLTPPGILVAYSFSDPVSPSDVIEGGKTYAIAV